MPKNVIYFLLAAAAVAGAYWYWKKHGKKLPTAPHATSKRNTRSQVGGFHKTTHTAQSPHKAETGYPDRLQASEIGRSSV